MAGLDQEARREAAHAFVGGGCDLDLLHAAGMAALTQDPVRALRLPAPVELLDPLVDLAQQRLMQITGMIAAVGSLPGPVLEIR